MDEKRERTYDKRPHRLGPCCRDVRFSLPRQISGYHTSAQPAARKNHNSWELADLLCARMKGENDICVRFSKNTIRARAPFSSFLFVLFFMENNSQNGLSLCPNRRE